MDYQRFHVCHVCKQREYLEVVDEFEGVLLGSVDFECEYRAAAVGEVTFIQVMVGVARNRWVVDLLDFRLFLEVFYHFQRVFYVALNTQAQCFESLQEYPGVERGERGTFVA